MSRPTCRRPRREIVTLADLARRGDLEGGAERRVFGAEPVDITPGPGCRAADRPITPTKDGKGDVLAIGNRDARQRRPFTR